MSGSRPYYYGGSRTTREVLFEEVRDLIESSTSSTTTTTTTTTSTTTTSPAPTSAMTTPVDEEANWRSPSRIVFTTGKEVINGVVAAASQSLEQPDDEPYSVQTRQTSGGEARAATTSAKILVIFVVVVFCVLLLFILIYYYFVRGMRNQQSSRIVPKSTSGSVNDEGARNIFANPEHHLAVDQSARTSTGGSESPTSDVNPAAVIAREGRSEGGSPALDQSAGSLVSKEPKEDSQGSKGFKMAREKLRQQQQQQQQQQPQQQQPQPKQLKQAPEGQPPPVVQKTSANIESNNTYNITTNIKQPKQTDDKPKASHKSLTKKSSEPAGGPERTKTSSKVAPIKSVKSHKSDGPQPVKGRRYSMAGVMAGMRDVMKDVHENSKERQKS